MIGVGDRFHIEYKAPIPGSRGEERARGRLILETHPDLIEIYEIRPINGVTYARYRSIASNTFGGPDGGGPPGTVALSEIEDRIAAGKWKRATH